MPPPPPRRRRRPETGRAHPACYAALSTQAHEARAWAVIVVRSCSAAAAAEGESRPAQGVALHRRTGRPAHADQGPGAVREIYHHEPGTTGGMPPARLQHFRRGGTLCTHRAHIACPRTPPHTRSSTVPWTSWRTTGSHASHLSARSIPLHWRISARCASCTSCDSLLRGQCGHGRSADVCGRGLGRSVCCRGLAL